jgi:hypothetical protein
LWANYCPTLGECFFFLLLLSFKFND